MDVYDPSDEINKATDAAKNWWTKPVPWYQFWNKGSGWVGGVITGLIFGIIGSMIF